MENPAQPGELSAGRSRQSAQRQGLRVQEALPIQGDGTMSLKRGHQSQNQNLDPDLCYWGKSGSSPSQPLHGTALPVIGVPLIMFSMGYDHLGLRLPFSLRAALWRPP